MRAVCAARCESTTPLLSLLCRFLFSRMGFGKKCGKYEEIKGSPPVGLRAENFARFVEVKAIA